MKYITIAKLGKPFGVHGYIKIHTTTEDPLSIMEYDPWWIQEGDTWQKIKFDQIEHQHDAIFVGHIPGIDSPEEARKYTNREIKITREQLPKLNNNEFYQADLEGLQVVNLDGKTLGHVDHILETGANDVIVVKGEKTHFIPFLLEQFVTKIDLDKKLVTVDWDPEF